MKAVRLVVKRTKFYNDQRIDGDIFGTCAYPDIYDALTLRALQARTEQWTWVCGFKDREFPIGDNSQDVVWCQLEVYEKLGWIWELEWFAGMKVCCFKEQSGHFHHGLQCLCDQLGWYLYKPMVTWKSL